MNLKKAGVAKMSLYNNFSSKADLVQTYIDERHQEWLGLYQERLKTASSPTEKVLAVFDAYIDHAAFEYERGFRGCGILNAAAELPAGAPGRVAVKKHKNEVEQILRNHLLEITRVSDEEAQTTAEHLSFLLEGSISRAGLDGNNEKIIRAKKLASSILEQL